MRHVKEGIVSLIVALLLVFTVRNLDNPDQAYLVEPQMIESTTDTSLVEGIPEEIQGVWQYEGDMPDQRIVLRGNQLITSDDYSGTVYYSITQSELDQADENLANSEDLHSKTYLLEWDKVDYQERYGDAALAESGVPSFFVLTYHEDEDTIETSNQATFHRDRQTEGVHIIQDLLLESQPINKRQLSQVNQTFLMEEYERIRESKVEEELLTGLYLRIAEEYPDLNLVTGDDLQTYLKIVDIFEMNSDRINFQKLNQANPSQVVQWYKALDEGLTDEEIVEKLTPKIEEAVTFYKDENFKAENQLKH